jgi:hypothetical protein
MRGCHKRICLDIIIWVIKNVRSREHEQGKYDNCKYDGVGIFDMGIGMRWHLVYITVHSERVV